MTTKVSLMDKLRDLQKRCEMYKVYFDIRLIPLITNLFCDQGNLWVSICFMIFVTLKVND